MKKTIISASFIFFASLSMANEEAATPNAENNFIQDTQSFDDWSVGCVYEKQLDKKGKETKRGLLKDCQITQIFKVKTGDDNQDVANMPEIMRMYMIYERSQEGVAEVPSLFFHIPLRAFLQPQVALQVDENDPIIVPYNFCDQGGCYAGGKLDEAVTEQFQKGNAAKIVFFNDARQPMALDLSLKGYTKAVNYLTEQKQNLDKEVKLPK